MKFFRQFGGFGIKGLYLGHWKEEPTQIALNVLSSNIGKELILRYQQILRPFRRKLSRRKSSYDLKDMFIPRKERITTSTDSLDGFLKGVLTDNIEIEVVDEDITYEIQRIVLGEQQISELRIHKTSELKKNRTYVEYYR